MDLCKAMHIIKILTCDTGQTHSNFDLMLLIWFNSNRIFSRFYLTKFSCYILTISYVCLVASPYLKPAVKFTAFSFGQLSSACSTPVFYRRTAESILTGSSVAQKTLTFRIFTTLPAQ